MESACHGGKQFAVASYRPDEEQGHAPIRPLLMRQPDVESDAKTQQWIASPRKYYNFLTTQRILRSINSLQEYPFSRAASKFT